MEPYFTVGELSRFSRVSKQTLIYYDREGIFKPEKVNKENGYRYYSARQIEVLDSILILKEIGLSLKEIREFMENRNSESAVILLKQQKSRIDENIYHLELIAGRVQQKIKTLEEKSARPEGEVYFEYQEEEYLALEKVRKPYGLVEVDIALKKLLNRAGKEDYPYFYQIGDMVQAVNLEAGRYTIFDYAILPMIAPVKNCEMIKKPSGMYAKASHKGSYRQTGKTYETMLSAIKAHGYKAVGHAYEYCVLDSLTSGSDREYVTQIQIPVEE